MAALGGLVVLVRHGRTDWNRAGRYQGWADVDLDEVGRRQAAAAAERLDRLYGRGAVVLSSDLRRARQTARVIAGRWGAAVVAHRGLREVDLGAWEGLTREEAGILHPDEFRAWEACGEARAEVRRGGGETPAEAGRRFADTLELALEGARTDGSWPSGSQAPAIVVAHGLVIQAGLCELVTRGVLVPSDGPIPHLANGEHLAMRLPASLATVGVPEVNSPRR